MVKKEIFFGWALTGADLGPELPLGALGLLVPQEALCNIKKDTAETAAIYSQLPHFESFGFEREGVSSSLYRDLE